MKQLAVTVGHILVDFDGTLAHYDKWVSITHTGKPIPAMVERVKTWLAEGRTVKIFTARVAHDNSPGRMIDAEHARSAIQQWCLTHIGRVLEVTNQKDMAAIEIWDDRAVQVVPNTGHRADGK